MKPNEIESSLQSLNVRERLELTARISYLNYLDDSSYRAEPESRMTAMDAGCKSAPTEIARIHKSLSATGR